MEIKFAKATTNGNDFVIIEKTFFKQHKDCLTKIANRRFGIGCDQVIIVHKFSENEYELEFYNQDGSHAAMCGNGTCAALKYLHERTIINDQVNFLICGTKYKGKISDDYVSAEFPLPKRMSNFIDTGNKHKIFNMQDIKNIEELSKEHHEYNLHFIEHVNQKTIRMKTYERGAGWTLACGSGAVAVAFNEGILGDIYIIHDGGNSTVNITENSAILKTDPKIIFDGIYYVE